MLQKKLTVDCDLKEAEYNKINSKMGRKRAKHARLEERI